MVNSQASCFMSQEYLRQLISLSSLKCFLHFVFQNAIIALLSPSVFFFFMVSLNVVDCLTLEKPLLFHFSFPSILIFSVHEYLIHAPSLEMGL